jgi:sugar (pentulose or hexulose) kinase
MLATAHLARQMLWLETGWADIFIRAKHCLATLQYWSWRLAGVVAGEATSLAAQSHMWCPAERRQSLVVATHGWKRYLPGLVLAWQCLGKLKPEQAQRVGLSASTRVI